MIAVRRLPIDASAMHPLWHFNRLNIDYNCAIAPQSLFLLLICSMDSQYHKGYIRAARLFRVQQLIC